MKIHNLQKKRINTNRLD